MLLPFVRHFTTSTLYQSCQGCLVSQSENRGLGDYGDSEEFASTKMSKFVLLIKTLII